MLSVGLDKRTAWRAYQSLNTTDARTVKTLG